MLDIKGRGYVPKSVLFNAIADAATTRTVLSEATEEERRGEGGGRAPPAVEGTAERAKARSAHAPWLCAFAAAHGWRDELETLSASAIRARIESSAMEGNDWRAFRAEWSASRGASSPRAADEHEEVCSYLPLHFKRILLTILTCPPHMLTFKKG